VVRDPCRVVWEGRHRKVSLPPLSRSTLAILRRQSTRVILPPSRDELRAKGVTFPVELKKRVNGSLLCYVAAPEGVSIELIHEVRKRQQHVEGQAPH
jgi:hypothetical protein